MPPLSKMRGEDIDAIISSHERKEVLRFVACGSAGGGKSTLVGHLLYELKAVPADELDTLAADSRDDNLNFALLSDSLMTEREQGITIDAAHRFFSTERRRFIVADAPGSERYTRNMLTAASSADVAVLVVDATEGIRTQSRRHSLLASLIGVRNIVVAVNKMDRVDWSEKSFRGIADEFASLAKPLGFADIACIPISALKGDNIVGQSERMGWYRGATLLGYLETVPANAAISQQRAFRLPVQLVNRPNQDFCGFAGTVVSGTIKAGDRVCVQPTGGETRIARIVTADGDLEQAIAGQAITLTFTDDIVCSPGNVVASVEAPAGVADQFEATVVWMSERPMLPGRRYLVRIGSQTANAQIGHLKHKLNIQTLSHDAATTLELNEIGVLNLTLDRQIAFDPYKENRETGSFVIIGSRSNNSIAAGMLNFSLRRASNIPMLVTAVNKEARAAQKGQKGCVIWLTGLSGSGKSAIANLLEKKLHARGNHTYILDGDNLRHGLNKDLGFTAADRVENIRRVAEVARLMVDAGLIVITAFISPFRAERQLARSLVKEGEFFEIFVDTPLVLAEERDPKGLYKKARRGELINFTGIDSPYEIPERPELIINTSRLSVEMAVDTIIGRLSQAKIITG